MLNILPNSYQKNSCLSSKYLDYMQISLLFYYQMQALASIGQKSSLRAAPHLISCFNHQA